MNVSHTQDDRCWRRWLLSGAISGISPMKVSTRQDYDTADGIAARLTSLDGFNAIMKARSKAGYTRREELREWIVFGRYFLDSCGNTLEMTDLPSADMTSPDSLPVVLSGEEFFAGAQAQHSDQMRQMRAIGCIGSAIPPTRMRCAVCQKHWTLKNFWDCEGSSADLVVPLHRYVGKTLAEVRRAFSLLPDAEYYIGSERAIRNDRLIDHRPHPQDSTLFINELGWMKGKVPANYVIQKGDEAFVQHFRFEHSACRKERLAALVESRFRTMFQQAGYDAQALQFKRVPNLRAPESEKYNGPGFQVDTPFGEITIGWRKYVIELDWRSTKKGLPGLFRDTGAMSRGPYYVHANTYEEAGDFLDRLSKALNPPAYAAR